MRILFLSRWFPFPPSNGAKLRIYNLLRALAGSHTVTLIAFTDQAVSRPPVELYACCETIHLVPYIPFNPTSRRALLGIVNPKPRWIIDTYSPAMDAQIRQTLREMHHDIVIASQWDMAAYYPAFAGTPALFEEAELGVFDTKRQSATSLLQRIRHELPWLKLRFYLRRLASHFDAITVASDTEEELLTRMLPGYDAIKVIPNCVALNSYDTVEAQPQPNTLIFTGALSYFANADAMSWFVDEIYPRIRVAVPDVHLRITGNHAGHQLPDTRNITLTGFVDDVRPLVANSWISLAPIRFGGGTRLKILEAMALRTPVVATSKGAEGLSVRHDEHMLIADTPADYAAAVVRLLRDRDLRRRLTDNAYRLVQQRYTWDIIAPHLLTLVEAVAATPPTPAVQIIEQNI